MNINQNNNLHFGMAYKMKGDTAERLAKYFHESRVPKEMEDTFIKMANELKKLTTEVVAEDGVVKVTNPITKQVYRMSDAPAWQQDKFGKVIQYPVQAEAHCGTSPVKTNIGVRYSTGQSKIGSPAWDSNYSYDGIMREHLHALEIGKEFDRLVAIDAAERAAAVAKAENIATTTNKLQELFG